MSQYKVYVDYKDSGIEWIGQIPEQWEIKKYKRTFTFINGHGFPHNLQGDKKGDKPFLKVSDISFKGKYVEKSSNYVSDLTIKLNKWNEIEPYSILTAKIGESLRKNHRKINIIPCIIDNNMMGLTSNIKDNLDYLYYILNVVDLDWYSNPGAVPSVNNRHFREDFLMIPPYQEQIKISHFLNKKTSEIDNLISDKESLIELLEEKRQAVITETVTKGLDPNVEMKDSGIEWIGEIPEHWEIKKFKHLFNIVKRIVPVEKPTILSMTQKGIKIKDISNNEGQIASNYDKYQKVEIDDFVMNHMDLLTGFVDYSKIYGVTSPDYRVFNLIEPGKHDKDYFLYYLQMCYYLRIFYGFGQGVAKHGRWRLQTQTFKNFYAPLPPSDEQVIIKQNIEKEINEINETVTINNQLIDKLKKYRESLVYEAVTGKIDVRDYAVEQEEVY